MQSTTTRVKLTVKRLDSERQRFNWLRKLTKNAWIYMRADFIALSLFFCLLINILVSNCYCLAHEHSPETIEHLKIAKEYLDLGKYDQAKVELQGALKHDPKSPDILNNLGAIYVHLGQSNKETDQRAANLNTAKDYFTQALSIDPGFAAAWNSLADVFYLEGESKKAISYYQKALTLSPKHAFEIYTNLANVQRDAEETKTAEENYHRAIELNPLYAPAHNGYAELLYNQHSLSEALPEALEAIRLKPDYAMAYYHLGLIQVAGGNNADALKAFMLSARYETNSAYLRDTDKLISRLGINPRSVSAKDLEQYKTSICQTPADLALQGNEEKAAKNQAVSELDKVKAPQLVSEQKIIAESKWQGEKLPAVEASIKSGQKEIKALEVLISEKKWAEANVKLSHLIKTYPYDPVLLNEQGLVFFSQKNYLAAEKAYNQAIAISGGKFSAAYYNLGLTYLTDHNLSKAKDCLETAKTLDKERGRSCALIENALARVFKQAGDLFAAKSAYDRAVADGGSIYPVIHYNLAVLLEQTNKIKEAAQEFSLYLQLSPKGFNAQSARNHLNKIRQ